MKLKNILFEYTHKVVCDHSSMIIDNEIKTASKINDKFDL